MTSKYWENRRKEEKKEKKQKEYPKDYTKEQQEEIKKLVIERIKTLPKNLRLSVG